MGRISSAIENFMEAQGYEALTFGDVSLETGYADFMPDQGDLSSMLTRNIPMHVPFISAAMDTVTESRMAIAMASLGGIGVIHKNLSAAEQATEVSRVKRYLHGLISDPVVFSDDVSVEHLLEEKRQNNYTFAGFPIINKEGRLAGILTARDTKFLSDYNMNVADVMTKDLIVGREGTTMKEAFELMVKNKVGKLPIVDDDYRLIGLYSFSDVRRIIENIDPALNRDSHHQLRVAAAIGPYDRERIEVLLQEEVDCLVVDTAHGHSKGVVDTVAMLKNEYPQVDVVAGNVASEEGAKAVIDAGADAVKVGVGPGSICTTRVVAGVGVPQLTAVYRAAKGTEGTSVPVIADGGICYSGDVAKALAVGADSVMMGSALAGTEESPGERILHQGRTFVDYRGMGAVDAMKEGEGSRQRYGHHLVSDPSKFVPQGIEGLVPYRGQVADVMRQFIGGLRFAFGYVGGATIEQYRQKASFVRLSKAGVQESHPHDVKVMKDAPNYQVNT